MPTQLPYKFRARRYQRPFWKFMEGGGKRAVLVWHRRAGKDLNALNWLVFAAMQRVGTYWIVYPTLVLGRSILWEGKDDSGRKFLDYIPADIIDGVPNIQEMRVTLKNGSTIKIVGADQGLNRVVGPNPVGVVFSEYSIMDPSTWPYILPILQQNHGWAVFIYTPRGKNHGHKLFEHAKKMQEKNGSWFCSLLTVRDTMREDGTPIFTEEDLAEARTQMTEAMVQQEYFCSFEAPVEGAYFETQMMNAEAEGRIITDLAWEPDFPVDTGWDIGWNDLTCIPFMQQIQNRVHVIDFYKNNGEGLIHYANVVKAKPYSYGRHFGPHDLAVHDLSDERRRSRADILRNYGIRVRVVKRHLVADRIEAIRNILPRCWFDQNKAAYLIEALKGYHKEILEEKAGPDQEPIFSEQPTDDWTTHPVDAFGQYAFGYIDRSRSPKKPPQERAVDDYDELG